jgi:hypothetical protein
VKIIYIGNVSPGGVILIILSVAIIVYLIRWIIYLVKNFLKK